MVDRKTQVDGMFSVLIIQLAYWKHCFGGCFNLKCTCNQIKGGNTEKSVKCQACGRYIL